MTIDDKIRDKKLPWDIIIWKNWKYGYLPGEEILSSNKRQIIEQIEKEVGAIKSLYLSNKKRWIKTDWGYVSTKSDNDLIRVKLLLLKQIIYIINQKVKRFMILVNILCLLFFKRCTWRTFIITRCWWWAKQFCC